MSSNYTGNPANFPFTIQLPSDGDGPPIKAADVNPGFEGNADAIANLRMHALGIQALNWITNSGTEFATTTGDPLFILDYAYSAFHGWTFVVFDHGNVKTRHVSTFDFSTWNESAVANLNPVRASIAANPILGAPTFVASLVFSSSATDLIKWDGTTQTLSTTSLPSGADWTQTNYSGICFNGVFIWGLFNTVGTVACNVITSADGVIIAEQSFGTNAPVSNTPRGPLYWAASPTIAVGLESGDTSGFRANNYYFTTTDGATFTPAIFAAAGNPGQEMFRGACWSAETGLFYAISTDISSSATANYKRLYSSPDGTTWTLINTLSSAGAQIFNIEGLAAVGTQLILTGYTGAIVTSTPVEALSIYSVDGGAHWFQVPDEIGISYSATFAAPSTLVSKVAASNGRFVWAVDVLALASIRAGTPGNAFT